MRGQVRIINHQAAPLWQAIEYYTTTNIISELQELKLKIRRIGDKEEMDHVFTSHCVIQFQNKKNYLKNKKKKGNTYIA
jgi:hypothetical protein